MGQRASHGAITILRSPSLRRHTTIDERIMQILANKQWIFDAFAGARQGRTARIATSLVPLAHASLRIE